MKSRSDSNPYMLFFQQTLRLYLSLWLCLFIWNGRLFAQEFVPKDTIYDSKVHTVQLFHNSDSIVAPVLYLKSNQSLSLQFDLLESHGRRLYYSIYHFNSDWTPSDLELPEYMEGFDRADIADYSTSLRTLYPYTHYSLSLPNSNCRFLVSGNYIVLVYEEDNTLLLSRRFFITDQSFSVKYRIETPYRPAEVHSHQEFTFEVQAIHSEKHIATNEVTLQVWQNQNPYSLISSNDPNSSLDNIFRFDKRSVFSFPGLKEFRQKDIRTVVSKTRDIVTWDEKGGDYHAYLTTDFSRAYKPFVSDFDFNGRYVITGISDQNKNTSAEYFKAHFRLEVPEVDKAVYIVGALTDWQLKPEFKMQYDQTDQSYKASVLLKTGIYNFLYAVPDERGLPDFSELEGNSQETENEYYMGVYYRPFGARYDQLKYFKQFFSYNK